MKRWAAVTVLVCLACSAAGSAPWPEAQAPVIPAADGFVKIPDAAEPPTRERVYHAVFDATQEADVPGRLVPALNMAGSELNALGVHGFPMSNAKFVIVFHGPAVNGILDAEHYRGKFGVDNPNLPVLDQMAEAGVDLYVCGQFLAAEHIDPQVLSPRVKVASDALLVLMDYQQRGYALMSF